MQDYQKVCHTFGPLWAPDSRVLILGSIPSPKSRETGFYYGHPRNRFWQVLARVLGEACPQTVEEKRALCLSHHIALWDVLAECEIRGASDAAIRAPKANDIAGLIAQTEIAAVFTTGAKSAELYRKLIGPKVAVPMINLPSTSPANAAWSVDRLSEKYYLITQYL